MQGGRSLSGVGQPTNYSIVRSTAGSFGSSSEALRAGLGVSV